MRLFGIAMSLGATFLTGLLGGTGCSSTNSAHANGDAGPQSGEAGSCTNPPALTDDNYGGCGSTATCSSSGGCQGTRIINACCAWVQPPTVPLARGLNLHYFSATDPNVNLDCLANPLPKGTSKTVTLNGVVKLFSSGNDSTDVKIEVYQEGAGGALGPLVGAAAVTPPSMSPTAMGDETGVTWLSKCPPGSGCTFRHFSYPGVPTETPLIIKTSDNSMGSTPYWAELYDYNIYFSNSLACATDPVTGTSTPPKGTPCVSADGTTAQYDVSAVAATDVNLVATTAGGFTVAPDKGVLAGEIHDCGDVRLSGATIDTDATHDGPMFYFGTDETNPLPDQTRAQAGLGTSTLSLFGALNFAVGTPIRISAVGMWNGQDTLIGTYVIQVFPGAVTALSLRGRRPTQ
jgi:hypothetical protein